MICLHPFSSAALHAGSRNVFQESLIVVKHLRGSAIETDDGNHRFVAQVTVYARALGVALSQKTYDTHDSSERAALKELLSSLDLDGVLIQADALHTTQSFFAGASPRGPTCS